MLLCMLLHRMRSGLHFYIPIERIRGVEWALACFSDLEIASRPIENVHQNIVKG